MTRGTYQSTRITRLVLPVVTFASGFGAAMLLATGSLEPQNIIEAKGFKLVGDDGKMRGAWSVAEGEALFYLYDKKQQRRIALRAGDHPTICLYGSNGVVSLQIRQHPDDGTDMILYDQNGAERVAVTATKSLASVRVLDSRRLARIWAKCGPDDVVSLEVKDGNDQTIWQQETNGVKRLDN